MGQKIAKFLHRENTKHDLKVLAEPTDPALPKPKMKAKREPLTRVRSYAELGRASKPALENFWYIDSLKDLKELTCRRSAMRDGARPQPRPALCQRQPVRGARLPRVGHSPYPALRHVPVRLAGTIGRALPCGVYSGLMEPELQRMAVFFGWLESSMLRRFTPWNT
jgi:hypothetical protein